MIEANNSIPQLIEAFSGEDEFDVEMILQMRDEASEDVDSDDFETDFIDSEKVDQEETSADLDKLDAIGWYKKMIPSLDLLTHEQEVLYSEQIQNVLSKYDQIMIVIEREMKNRQLLENEIEIAARRLRLMSNDFMTKFYPLFCSNPELIDLSRDLKYGFRAADILYRSNLRLAVKISYDFVNFGIAQIDLIQFANIGLLRAVPKYKGEFGVRFSSYAKHWIRQEIRRGIENSQSAIRLPTHIYEKFREITKFLTQKFENSNIDDIPKEIIKEVLENEGFGRIAINAWMHKANLQMNPLSFETPISEGGLTLTETIRSREISPEVTVYEHETMKEINSEVEKLKQRHSTVIIKRFGLLGQKEQTLQEIANELGLTRERVRQIESKAIQKLRQSQKLKVVNNQLSEGF